MDSHGRSYGCANEWYREEQKPLEDFFAAKNLKIRNEMLDDVILNLHCYLAFHANRC